MEAGNKREVSLILRCYKTNTGAENFPVLLSIPLPERIPTQAKLDFKRMSALISAGLTMAFENMNLKRPMNEFQILDLSEAIIDSSHEDQLSIEDLMLFLQNLVRGKYEALYESMDIPKFMEKFEIYRQERHEATLSYNENRHLELKGLGPTERNSDGDDLDKHFSQFTGRITELKENLREKIQENKKLKDIDGF